MSEVPGEHDPETRHETQQEPVTVETYDFAPFKAEVTRLYKLFIADNQDATTFGSNKRTPEERAGLQASADGYMEQIIDLAAHVLIDTGGEIKIPEITSGEPEAGVFAEMHRAMRDACAPGMYSYVMPAESKWGKYCQRIGAEGVQIMLRRLEAAGRVANTREKIGELRGMFSEKVRRGDYEGGGGPR
jgi:hypothetical protein